MSEFCRANAAQALVNTLFGSSTIVAAIGLNADSVHPLLFGTLRAGVTAVLLLSCHVLAVARRRWCGTGADVTAGVSPSREEPSVEPRITDLFTKDRTRFFFMILFLYSGNSFNLVGVQFAGAVTASLWQPSQPIFTMVSAALLGTEHITVARAVGVLLTVSGCLIMIAGSAHETSTGAGTGRSARNPLLGNFCLLINCLSTPLYIIVSKPLVQRRHPPLMLAGTCFACNTCFFATAFFASRLLARLDPTAMSLFMCGTHEPASCIWSHPPAFGLGPSRAVFAVLYSAIFATALPQRLQLFANRILRASLLSAYYAFQPIATLLIGYTIILATPPPHFGLRRARVADLGGLGVLFGLLIVVREEMLMYKQAEQEEEGGTNSKCKNLFRPETHSLLNIKANCADSAATESMSEATEEGVEAEPTSAAKNVGECIKVLSEENMADMQDVRASALSAR